MVTVVKGEPSTAAASAEIKCLAISLRLTQGLDRLRQNEPLWRLFNIVNRWVPAWRYNADLSKREDAEDFLEAVEKVAHWIDNNV